MKSNWQLFKLSLKNHPGVDIAIVLPLIGALAGVANKNMSSWWMGALVGGGVMCIVWVPVLYTAWDMRHQYQDKEQGL